MVDRIIMVDGLAVRGSPGVCGVEGVSGRRCKARDRAQISSSQQMSSEVETGSEIFMVRTNAALEHRKKHNVAGFSLEFERLDDCRSPKRQNCELECESGGKRDWSDKATVDGIGPVVETVAQDGSPVDPKLQHERVECSTGQVMLPEWTTQRFVRRP